MRFFSPGWLWLLLLFPVFYGVLLWDEKNKQKRFELFAQRFLWPTIAPEMDPAARLRKAAIWLVAGAFAIIALARPQWGTREETTKMSGLDVAVVLDVSSSMETEDVVPSRLKKAKHLIRNLAEQLKGDRLGLVTFAGGANVAAPLTTDIEYFLEVLSYQTPQLMPNQGTDIGLGLETALKAMDRGSEASSGSSGSSQPSRAVILVTDGEDHEGQARDAASHVRAEGVQLYVFGIGTSAGGPIPHRDDQGTLQGYKRDQSGKPIISQFRPDDLTQIAATGGGRYWNVTTDESEISDLIKDMGGLSRGEFAERHYLVYEERYQYPLLIAVLLLLLETSIPARRVVSAVLLIALAGFVMGERTSQASEVEAGEARYAYLDTYLENKKGIEAYKEGKIEEAQKRFGAAQALDPSLPELQYNQGLIKMQQGDADSAAHDFQDAARGAMKKGDKNLVGRSFFNLGATLSKKGDMKGAIDSYVASIHSAQQSGNASLEQDARKNLELLIQEQQKQKQQQKNDQQKQQQQQQQQQQQNQQNQQNQQSQQQQNQNQDSKNGQGSEKKQSNDGDQKKEQDKGSEQQQAHYDNSTSRGKKFESKKLNAEDAERVMAELKNRERDVQVRLKKENGKVTINSKDW